MAYTIIRTAIERKQAITANYENYVRFFSPHALGEDQSGSQAVLGFQYGGGRPGGLPVSGDWCLFSLAGLSHLRVNGDEWIGGPPSKPLHLLRKIDVQV